MSRFRPGQTVYFGEEELTIEEVIDKPMIPIYQYSFIEKENLRVGEQSLRASLNDPKLKISDCYKNDSDTLGRIIHDGASWDEYDESDRPEFNVADFYGSGNSITDPAMALLNTNAAIFKQPIDAPELGFMKNEDGGFGSLFFKPDIFFVDWLVKYANGRIIMDIGAGQGHLVRMIKKCGGRATGIEPNFDRARYVKSCVARGDMPNNDMLSKTVQQAASLIQSGRDKILLVFARPCHSNFVEVGIDLMDKSTEALYITIPENLTRYNDLGKYKDIAEKIEFEGTSEDNEVVLSIKKS